MLAKLIKSLRDDLTPLVRAELEIEIEKKIREERKSCIEQELFEEFFESGEVLKRWHNIMERLQKEIEPTVKNSVEFQLYQNLRASVIEGIRKEKEAQINEEFSKLLVARKNGLLADYFSKEEYQQIRSEVEEKLRKELEIPFRRQFRTELRDSIQSSLSEEIMKDMKESPRFIEEVKSELKNELTQSVIQELRIECKEQVLTELKESMESQVEDKLRTELILPLVKTLASSEDETLANALALGKHHMEKAIQIRITQQILFEVSNNLSDWLKNHSNIPPENIEKILSSKSASIIPNPYSSIFSNFILVRIASSPRKCTFTDRIIDIGELFLIINSKPCSLPRTHGEAKYFAKMAHKQEHDGHSNDDSIVQAELDVKEDEFLKI
jgi:hypothetical protein